MIPTDDQLRTMTDYELRNKVERLRQKLRNMSALEKEKLTRYERELAGRTRARGE